MLLCFLIVTISTITRIALTIKVLPEVELSPTIYGEIFLIGLFYDLVNGVYFSLPLVLYLWIVPTAIYRTRLQIVILHTWFFISTFTLLFNAIAEWLFWDEFNTRFNFIAVDYLIYTTEVIGNIRQSYPIEWIIGVILLLALIIMIFISRWIKSSQMIYVAFKARTVSLVIYALIVCLPLFGIDSKYHRLSDNSIVNELSGNGMYELFAAYRNNELDYDQFYRMMDLGSAFRLVRENLKTSEAEYVPGSLLSINRHITNTGGEKKMNVVLISIESFSAEFMARFGNKEAITPFLDSLSEHSLFFTNLFATGTRTVRGLEALSLCVPPTPGQSIVRRPNNEQLFSLGKVFTDKGYASQFIYGGYSYFDNMGYFFENNNYRLIDRSALEGDEIDYENIWGVADEDMFDLALREIEKDVRHRPVFSHILTTSNHRPFTYPDGRIDIPSHTSRKGAVKYTDYSIGRFIREASKRPWFANTIFVIVSDHCASSAGKTELPVNKYHIPMLIYSPGNIESGTMDRLMSQIDIGPTVLGLLNFSYTSNFYGYDMFKLEPGRERAFISTYQNLGYIRDKKLIILSPQSKIEAFSLSENDEVFRPIQDEKMVAEAMAWYQVASYSFKNGLMKSDDKP